MTGCTAQLRLALFEPRAAVFETERQSRWHPSSTSRAERPSRECILRALAGFANSSLPARPPRLRLNRRSATEQPR